MSWTSLDASPQWNVDDTDLLAQSFYMLLENAGTDPVLTNMIQYNSTMFTPHFFMHALYDRQRQFLKDTAVVVKRVTQGSAPGIGTYDLPQDWMDTRRLDFRVTGGNWTPLFRTDAYSLDHGSPEWQSNLGTPDSFQETTELPLQVEIGPAPQDAGDLILTYLGTPDRPSFSLPVASPFYGLAMMVPDEFTNCLLYGALADMLNADGEGRDPKRAQYCQSRYDMGVQLAKSMLGAA